MNKIYIFGILAVVMAAAVVIQSASLEQVEDVEGKNCGNNLQNGRRCRKEDADTWVTKGNRTCFCRKRTFVFFTSYRYVNCSTVNGTTTETPIVQTTLPPVDTEAPIVQTTILPPVPTGFF